MARLLLMFRDMRETFTQRTSDASPSNPAQTSARSRPPREPQPGTDRVREPHPRVNPLFKAFVRVGLAVLFAVVVTTPLHAQDRVVLGEILPALEGTELGALPVADAPPPGSSRMVRRSEVLAALRRAGRSARGLRIPRAVRVRREVRELSREDLEALVRPAVARDLAPCAITDLRVPATLTIAPGEVSVESNLRVPVRASTSVSGLVTLTAGGQRRRVSVRARVSCPPPAVEPGSRVTVVAVVGPVRASAPGEARQPGRVGDVIRVHNAATGRTLMARVVAPDTVMVVR